MKYELIEKFFDNPIEYMRFLMTSKMTAKASADGSCVAMLKSEGGRFIYSLSMKDGRFVMEYVRPFRVNEEHLRIFNEGCKEIARRLNIYLETGDIDKAPTKPPAFGILSCETPDELAYKPPKEIRPDANRKYFPKMRDARVVKRYDAGKYRVILFTDVKCLGIIQCSHLLVALKKGEDEPSYVVASEVNNIRSTLDGSDSHYLCCYPGDGHINLGCSNDWGDLGKFEKKAKELMCKALGVTLV